jgi:hypothetical protein
MQATNNVPSSRGAIIAGVVLMIVGGAALISQLLPDYDRYVPLVVGLSLAAVFAVTRNYLALVFAGIMTGLGTGLVVAQTYPSSQADGAGAVLGLGLGFISVWVVSRLLKMREHHFWPLIPGFILVAVGTGLAADAFASNLGEMFVPAAVLVAGVLFLIGGLIGSRRTTSTGTQ